MLNKTSQKSEILIGFYGGDNTYEKSIFRKKIILYSFSDINVRFSFTQ